MFGLSGIEFPGTREQLAAAIDGGLRQVLTLPGSAKTVVVEGTWPNFDLLRVDLSGAQIIVDRPPPDFRWVGDRRPAFAVRRLEIAGKPLRVGPAPIDINLWADDALFEFDRDKAGRPLVVLTAARQGKGHGEMRRAALDNLIREGAAAASKKRGISLTGINLDLRQLAKLSFAAEARIQAKKLFVTAIIHVAGRVDLDDSMTAHLSGLRCTGEGVLGEIAAAAIRPQLAGLDGKSFSLSALGNLRLREVSVSVADPMTLDATFGE